MVIIIVIIDFIQPKIISRWVDHNNDFMISAGIVNTNEYISTIVGADYDEEEQQESGESGTDSVEAYYSSDQEVENEAAMTSENEQTQGEWFYLGDC